MDNQRIAISRPTLPEKIINTAGFAAIHLVCFLAIWTGVTWRAIVIALVLYWVRMFLITAGYHRYFAHHSYQTSRVFQTILAVLGTTAVQKGPIWWSSRHRIHHIYSDQPPDVHSPIQYGFWYAHVGWLLFHNRHSGTDLNYVRDWLKYPELVWLEKYHWVMPVLLTVACYFLDGWSGVVIGMGWSTAIFWHSTFLINSAAHLWGSQRYRTGDGSRNNALLAFLTMGEGWHNNHHHCRRSARQGFKWWEIDASYYILRLLALFGLVWGLKKPSPNQLVSKLINTPPHFHDQ